MRTHLSLVPRTLILAAVLGSACGGGGDGDGDADATSRERSATTVASPSESAYCDRSRQWAVQTLTPVDDGDPEAMRAYWKEYLAFVDDARSLAPAELHDAWELNATKVRETLTPVLEKFGFDPARVEAEGTDEEKAIAMAPPEDVQRAQSAIHRYESETCAAQQPPPDEAADFSGVAAPDGYCESVARENELFGAVREAGVQPADLEALTRNAEYLAVLDRERETAPPEIRADVVALHAFFRDVQVPLMARRGHDLREVLLDGPQADREVMQLTAPAVRARYARVAAFQQQACGG